MAAHEEILRAALRICRRRRGWRFRPLEIVQALPHLDPGTVRTHIVSRCCVNAPKHHPHKWDYFERISRGLYEIRRPYRRRHVITRRAVAESRVPYRDRAGAAPPPLGDTVHVVVSRSGDWYVAECLEIAVVTQARTLDELVDNIRDAVDLHLDGESRATFGLAPTPRLAITYELPGLT